MKMKIEFSTSCIPISYNSLFMSIIKEAIKKSNEDYYKNMYYYKEKNNKKTKNFTFSVYVKKYSIEGDNFIIEDKVILNISTPDLELGFHIYNGLMTSKKCLYKDYGLTRIRIDLSREKKVTEERVLFNALSPICVKSKEGKFLEITDDRYIEELNYITNEVVKNYRGSGLKRKLEFENIDLKKVVVKESLREFKKITGKEYQYINGYKGKFILKGDIDDLNIIYNLGLGFRRAQGFGDVDILEWR